MQIKRDFSQTVSRRLSEERPLIQIVLGPRQVGKTTAMRQIMQEWQGPATYASADLPHQLDRHWIHQCWQKARAEQLNSTRKSQSLLIIDEVQKVPSWSTEIKALFDEDRRKEFPLKVVLLGSASWLLQQGLNETLAGRFEIIKAHHWSFAECRECFDWDFNTYIKYGGYPAAAPFVDDTDRWQSYIRDAIIEPMLSRDIMPLKNIAKPALFRQTLALSMSYPAQEISLQKMLGQLQERGNSTTIKGYLELLSAGFVLRSLEKFSTRKISKKSSSPKILPLCPALIHAYTHPSRVDTDADWYGRVYEACLGASLANHYNDIAYWRDDNSEVDFVVENKNQIIGIEVKSGRKKNSQGLKVFRERFPHAKTLVMDIEMGKQFLLSKTPGDFIFDLL